MASSLRIVFRYQPIICVLAVSILLSCCAIQSDKPQQNSRIISLGSQQDSTQYYTYSITYPDSISSQIVADSLQRFALQNKGHFMDMLPADTSKFYVAPWELMLKSKKAIETDRFEAYETQLYLYTGGAHGMPSVHTLTFDRKKNALVNLQDLLQDTTALEPISRYAMNQIASKIYEKPNIEALDKSNRNWVMNGAAPLVKNYAVTRPAQPKNNVATGIDVIFGAYQVGPYATGRPHIFIPTSVFHDHLKPEYKSAFKSTE